MTRRALLGATAAGLTATGCSSRSPEPPAPKPPDPQAVLLSTLIRDKERLVSLYQRAALGSVKTAAALEPFRQRHVAHLAALREMLPPGAEGRAGAAPSPSPSGSPSPSEGPSVTVGRLRDAERRAAAGRPGQLAKASPALAQLLASIGACEAVHAVALGRLRD
ncbi:hypothetical protein [Sphaerimonospora thailandensis]|uniref:hypothetical protein n=1 Tax=Sphaerimonospora thailandensis TaxID=795644 RepID=UPI00194E77FD|nr:hypothetical protein [Sphaerimonospora thailandensis]